MSTPQQQAASIIAAQYAPIDYAMARTAKRSAAEQAALQQARLALVKQLQAGVGPAGRTYDAAVAQQQALAQAGAGLLGRLNPNAQIQSDLAAINAPQGQRDALAGQLQAQFPGQGGVLNIEQGTIPGASLVAQKAGQQQFLAGLPSVVALAGEQSLQGLLARAADSRDKLTEARLAAAGRIPELALSIEQQRAARANESAGASPQIIGSAGGGYWLVNPDTGAKQRLTPPNPGAGSTPKTITRKDGSVWERNPTTGKYVLKLPAQPGTGTSGLSASESSIIQNRAHGLGVGALDKLTARIWARVDAYYPNQQAAEQEFEKRKRQNWGTAMAAVIQAIGPQLKKVGYTPAQIKAEARSIVSTKITPPTGR